MKIAFTHNLQVSQTEEEAEFDRPETIRAISESLERLGHEVELVEVSGPASRVVARLEALNPALVFNTAEGRFGRYREAFYPGLFDQINLPYTGSDAYTCTVTLDKQLTKYLVASYGIPTPQWVFIDDIRTWTPPELRYPVLVKPNFEGSSKGIGQDSVIDYPDMLYDKVRDLLLRYPAGVLIEEFIPGRDVTVAFLEKSTPKTSGVLPPAEYHFETSAMSERKYNIYDFTLKQFASNAVSVKCPAVLTPAQMDQLLRYSKKIYSLLSVRDLGRIDYRVMPDGRIYFIEVNALPSLDAGAGIYLSAKQVGVKDIDGVLETVIRSAAERQGIKVSKSKSKIRRRPLRVAVTYNLKRIVPKQADDDDSEAEYDSPKTVQALGDAIASYGHDVVYVEATPEFASLITAAQVDLVFNIAEGIIGRNREAQVPSILELLGIPYTGSDPATLSLTLDKALSKKILIQAGVPTPKFFVMRTAKERFPKDMSFPVLIKPIAEGSSKGVMPDSVVENEDRLRELAAVLLAKYKQPMLVEEYLPGREFTLGLLGETRPKVLPPMEIVYLNPEARHPVYTFEHKLSENKEIRYDTPANVDAKLLRELERVARNAFILLGCRDVARIDLRLNRVGKPYFIECNPLPGLTPGWSDLCLIAQSAGMDYRTLIGEIMAPALRRYREKLKQNGTSARPDEHQLAAIQELVAENGKSSPLIES